jgi:hypothetical protein
MMAGDFIQTDIDAAELGSTGTFAGPPKDRQFPDDRCVRQPHQSLSIDTDCRLNFAGQHLCGGLAVELCGSRCRY